MGKFAKWIGAGLGWAFLGPIGGLVGFALGAAIDVGDAEKLGRQPVSTTGDFVVALLVLTAAVMKADGKIVKSELEYVKLFFIKNFGKDASRDIMLELRDILKKDIPVYAVAVQIKGNLDYSSRLELLHYLYGIANADQQVLPSELAIIETIAANIGINPQDSASIKSMFYNDLGALYQILEIEPTATNDDVKKAYRKMAVKYHPDKVNYLGDDFQKSAKEKFQKVNEAYEKIKVERGMS